VLAHAIALTKTVVVGAQSWFAIVFEPSACYIVTEGGEVLGTANVFKLRVTRLRLDNPGRHPLALARNKNAGAITCTRILYSALAVRVRRDTESEQ